MTKEQKKQKARSSRAARRRRWQAALLILRCIACALAAATLVFLGSACFPGNASQLIRGDTQPPSLMGVRDRQVYVGDSIAYRDGISVLDAVDPEPELTVDSSQVDLTTPGVYPVTYTSTDASGNTCTAEATVTVLELPEGWAAAEEIDVAVQKLIEALDIRKLDAEAQVRAIYDWAHSQLKYGGHTDRENVRQAAYDMLTKKQGDCYGYFALTKVLFDALEIPNLDVVKVKNQADDSDHFWSLVSVDGGEHYYHFDATPRVGQTESFCLITDEALDAYSTANKNSHNRDTSLYPATPKEALQ